MILEYSSDNVFEYVHYLTPSVPWPQFAADPDNTADAKIHTPRYFQKRKKLQTEIVLGTRKAADPDKTVDTFCHVYSDACCAIAHIIKMILQRMLFFTYIFANLYK